MKFYVPGGLAFGKPKEIKGNRNNTPLVFQVGKSTHLNIAKGTTDPKGFSSDYQSNFFRSIE